MLVMPTGKRSNPMVFFVLEVADDGLLGGLLGGLLHGDLRRHEGYFRGKNGCSLRIYCLNGYKKYSNFDSIRPVSNPARSQGNAFAGDVVQQVRVAVGVRVRPFVFPHGQGLNADAGVQQNVIGNVVHRHFGVDKVPSRPLQNIRHVRITLHMLRPPRPAAKQNGLLHRVSARHTRRKSAGGLQRGGGGGLGFHGVSLADFGEMLRFKRCKWL